MKQLFIGMVATLMAMTLHMPAMAADHGSADEAKALVKKAQAFLKANGPEKSIEEFNKPKSQFVDRDLYIFYMDMNGKMIAHGANPKLIGNNLISLKDKNDVYFIKGMIDVVKAKGSGWVDYQWPNPVTKVMEAKSTYVEKAGDMIVGAGIYK